MLLDRDLIQSQAEQARAYMLQADPEGLYCYHNWVHIQQVMDAVRMLSAQAGLEVTAREDLLLAAIWHDSDFSNGAKGHEARSAEVAAKYLQEAGLSEDRIAHIQELIRVTAMAATPDTKSQKLLRDADLSHLGSSSYFDQYENLYNEQVHTHTCEADRKAWKESCLEFLEKHHYFTEEAQNLWSDGKEQNHRILQAMDMSSEPSEEQEQRQAQEQAEATSVDMSDEEKEEIEAALSKEHKKALKKARKKREPKFNTEKGIETMFRVSLRNHINLSKIADDKANTLISVNAIILSIVLSALFPKLDSNPFLLYPGLSLILVSIITIIMATLSTIPKTTHGSISKHDVDAKKGNLLFFGNFHSMSLEEYEYGMRSLMVDGDYLYGSMTRDLYFLGKVLNRKYTLLRKAYFIFVLGLIISIVLFVMSVRSLEHISLF